ncbi:cysteine hydrolase [Clostridium sp. Maddingley MBC34-26]|nr:cysteine hydrolase [Clostridium sp. Maddingley MBC34-26]EKQ57367.1 MAG: nicotinamidase-like amidase [Clostridium sp. Maddingley MBC34-26]
MYFCPLHHEWFEDFNNDNVNYVYNLRAIEENQTIIDKWNTVSAPPAPELKSITVNPITTALLILDIENSICNTPHCIATIPNIYNLLTKARQYRMLVIYSLIPTANPSDIAKQISPLQSDPIVKSSVDKFYDTNLQEILGDNGIKNVIITGYAANGAVLHTATSAAFRGYNVIIPVDCMSASNPYAEQYTAWHMVNSPGTKNRAFLTKVNLIDFQTPQLKK